jgi:hypothetical protein
LLLACAAFCGAAQAAVAGVVVNLSGPLVDRKADGTVKVLAVKSEVESGDTLVTEKNTYARIRTIDKGEITLNPNTTFKIENFAYEDGKPEADSAAFSLIKGGLRSITGLLGKRNKEKFSLKTPTATIGIRGTTFIVQYVEPGADVAPVPGAPVAPGPAPLAPGLHLTVTDGAIVVTNQAGSQGFQAGQFGFVPSQNQPPIVLPNNPGLQFTPPPSFSGTAGPGGDPVPGSGGAPAQKGGVDCVVR